MFCDILPLTSFAIVHLSCADPSTSMPQNQAHNFLRCHDPRRRRLQAAITKPLVHDNRQPVNPEVPFSTTTKGKANLVQLDG